MPGTARTATSRWCSTARATRCAATTAATPSGCRRAARSARPSRSRVTARARSGSPRSSPSSSRRSRCLRLDSDAAARKGAHAAILAEFDRAEAGVLIGTQMVAKGHDFPDVVLSVVVDADSSLRFPGLPGRGADLRPRVAARRAQRPGRRGPRPRPDAGAGGRGDHGAPRPTTPPGFWPARSSGAGSSRTRRSRRSSGSRWRPRRRVRPRTRRARPPPGCGRCCPRDATLLGPAPRFRLRDRERRQVLVKAADARGDGRRGARGGRRLRSPRR